MSGPPDWIKDIAPRPHPRPAGPIERAPRLPKPPKGLNPVNRARKARDFKRCFDVCARMLREPDFHTCMVPFCGRKDIQVCHVRSRGARGADWANVVALCPDHHHEQGSQGIDSFQRCYEINLEHLAGEVALAVQKHSCAGRLDDFGRCRVCREAPSA
jgi:hypothetical protein